MKIKTTIIGFGGIGKFHSDQIGKTDVLEVNGVYDIRPERVELGKSLGYKGYDSLDDCLDDDSELVIVSTTNEVHKELSMAALKAGKHVIVEKPAMMNAEELAEVIEYAKSRGLIFTVHQNRRWDKDFLIVKKTIQDGIIGAPFYLESRVQGGKGIPGDWRGVKRLGGGMLLDWGVHLIDQILIIGDSPLLEIYAQLLNVNYTEVDDNIKIVFKFENGISALIEVDTCTFINLPRWHVSGRHGTLVINDWDCGGKIMRVNEKQFTWEESIVITSAGPTKTMAPRPPETVDEVSLPEVETDCKDFYVNVANSIRGTDMPIVSHKQMLRLMRVIDACFESSRVGRVIKGFEIGEGC